jgi:predicted acetyltransferase
MIILKISNNFIMKLYAYSIGNSSLILNKRKLATKNSFKFSINKQISSTIECMIQSKPNYRKYISTLTKDNVVQSDILIVAITLLEDVIYDKFGYEIEDVDRKIEEINYDTTKRIELRNKMEAEIAEIGNFMEYNLPTEGDNEKGNKKLNGRNT